MYSPNIFRQTCYKLRRSVQGIIVQLLQHYSDDFGHSSQDLCSHLLSSSTATLLFKKFSSQAWKWSKNVIIFPICPVPDQSSSSPLLQGLGLSWAVEKPASFFHSQAINLHMWDILSILVGMGCASWCIIWWRLIRNIWLYASKDVGPLFISELFNVKSISRWTVCGVSDWQVFTGFENFLCLSRNFLTAFC